MTHPRCFGWAAALLLAMAVSAIAQPPAKPKVPESSRSDVPERPVSNAADKVQGIKHEKMPEWASLNFRLYVRLGNGRNIIGIARSGNLFEKIVVEGRITDYERLLQQRYGITPSQSLTLKFIKAAPRDPEVGIRLWHHDATGGYIFILYRDVASVKRLQVITPAELKELDERAKKRKDDQKVEIHKKWEAYRQKQREAFKKQMAARREGAKEAKQADKAAAEDGAATEDAADEALFRRFHPSKGWTPGRKRVIEWRKWTLGTFPNAEEKDFLASYAGWKKAYDKWMSETGEKAKEKEGARDAPPPKG